MKLYANQLPRGSRVHDLETHRDLKRVLWVDVEACTAEAYATTADGKMVLHLVNGVQAWKTVLLSGRFKVVLPELRQPAPATDKVVMGAPACARCGSKLTLRGDDLCPACWIADRGAVLEPEPLGVFEFQKCDFCSRDASHSVSDEVEVTPERGMVANAVRIANGAYLFDRAMTVGRRYFCRWCLGRKHEGPRVLDRRGEVVRTDEIAV